MEESSLKGEKTLLEKEQLLIISNFSIALDSKHWIEFVWVTLASSRDLKFCSQFRLTIWLIDWMVFYATFNSISVISQRQLI